MPAYLGCARMVRVAAACFCVIVGLAGGYVLWGDRAETLALALDRLSMEYDAVRAHAGSDVTLRATIEGLSGRVREQGEALERQTEALGRLVGAQDVETAATARECDDIQVRIQEQLEACLFARARLEREVAAAKQAAKPPRAGTQTVTETIQVPQVPAKAAKRPDDEDSDRGVRLPFFSRDNEDDRERRPAGKGTLDGEAADSP